MQKFFSAAAYFERVLAHVQGKGYFRVAGEPSAIRALASNLIEARPVIFDGGANKGEWTAQARKEWPEGIFYLFEPSSTNIAVLKERFPDVSVVGLALSDRQTEATLFGDKAGSGIASPHHLDLAHLNIPHEALETVRTETIDSFCAAQGIEAIDVLKLDIEGHELQALQGARHILERTTVVQFEFGGCNIDSRTFMRDFHHLLEPLGFQIYRITPWGPLLCSPYRERNESFLIANYIAVRRADPVRARVSQRG